MSTWFFPPPPIVSRTGGQPHAGNKLPPSIIAVPVNQPDFQDQGRFGEVQAIIVAAWQSDYIPWQYGYAGSGSGHQPYGQRQLPPSITAVPVNTPPFVHEGRNSAFANIIAAWLPNAWPFAFIGSAQPYQKQLTNAGIPGRSLDPPIPNADAAATARAIIEGWQPTSWPFTFFGGGQPYQKILLSPGIPGRSVDQPPGFVNDYSPDPVDPFPLQQQLSRLRNAALPGLSVDNPPPYADDLADMNQIVSAWQPPDPFPVQPRYRQRISVDNPPRYSPRAQIGAVLQWQPPDPFASQPRYSLVQSGIVVTYVPFNQTWLAGVVSAWQPPNPAPLQRRTTFVPGMSVDQPPGFINDYLPDAVAPFYQPRAVQIAALVPATVVVTCVPYTRPWLINVAHAWASPVPHPAQRLPAQIVSVDQPRPHQTAWFATVVNAWQPVPPRIEPQRRLFPSGLAVRVDNPPFGMRGRITKDIVTTWQPSLYAYSTFQARARFIPMVAVRIVAHPSLRGSDFKPTLVGREREFE